MYYYMESKLSVVVKETWISYFFLVSVYKSHMHSFCINGMFVFFFLLGLCSVCGLGVYDDGCMAIERVYHNKCFVCQKCGTLYVHSGIINIVWYINCYRS